MSGVFDMKSSRKIKNQGKIKEFRVLISSENECLDACAMQKHINNHILMCVFWEI